MDTWCYSLSRVRPYLGLDLSHHPLSKRGQLVLELSEHEETVLCIGYPGVYCYIFRELRSVEKWHQTLLDLLRIAAENLNQDLIRLLDSSHWEQLCNSTCKRREFLY
jgi:hypothetical protein